MEKGEILYSGRNRHHQRWQQSPSPNLTKQNTPHLHLYTGVLILSACVLNAFLLAVDLSCLKGQFLLHLGSISHTFGNFVIYLIFFQHLTHPLTRIKRVRLSNFKNENKIFFYNYYPFLHLQYFWTIRSCLQPTISCLKMVSISIGHWDSFSCGCKCLAAKSNGHLSVPNSSLPFCNITAFSLLEILCSLSLNCTILFYFSS